MTELPVLRYHPDPLTTGEIARSDTECRSCGHARGCGKHLAYSDMS